MELQEPERITPEMLSNAKIAITETVGGQWSIPEREYYFHKTEIMAQELLGNFLLKIEEDTEGNLKFIGGRIVETEAYLGAEDAASHAARRTARAMENFHQQGGMSYVFYSYGIYHCFNVIVRPEGIPGCVLIRALEPILDINEMTQRRRISPRNLRNLCSGPGKLCQALGIHAETHNRYDLRDSALLVFVPESKEISISTGPRIGITKAAEMRLRYWITNSPWISRR